MIPALVLVGALAAVMLVALAFEAAGVSPRRIADGIESVALTVIAAVAASTVGALAIAIVAALLAGCGPTPPDPNSAADLATVGHVRRSEVRGAILVLDRALDVARVTCQEINDGAARDRCAWDLAAAVQAEKRADVALYAWEVDRTPVRCALVAASEALFAVVQTMKDAGIVRIPDALADGVDALAIVARIYVPAQSCAAATATTVTIDYEIISDAGDAGDVRAPAH